MDHITDRYEKLREYMRERRLDAVFISSPENYLYFSGYPNPDGFMVITGAESYVFADFRYIEAVRRDAYKLCRVCEQGETTARSIVEKHGIKTLGIEDNSLTVSAHSRLLSSLDGTGCVTVPLGGAIVEQRSVKYSAEVECIKRAQRIAEGAFSHLLSVINYDMTEIEAAAELEYFMKKNGSEMPAFDTIAVSGKASSVPHGTPRNVRLERGFLTLDFGAKVGGYCSDMTRTVVIGKADDDMKKLYNTVLEAQVTALDYLMSGGRGCLEADGLARGIIDGAGYEGCFGHGLGHGVGLLIHELPNLNRRQNGRRLVSGNIVTVEPGIYIEGKYGCRIEDMALITEDGALDLTDCPKELIEI